MCVCQSRSCVWVCDTKFDQAYSTPIKGRPTTLGKADEGPNSASRAHIYGCRRQVRVAHGDCAFPQFGSSKIRRRVGPPALLQCSDLGAQSAAAAGLQDGKEGYGVSPTRPPDPKFYAGVCGRGWKEKFYRSRPPTLLVTVGVNSYSHFFLVFIKTTQSNPTVDPSGNPDAHTCHSTSH